MKKSILSIALLFVFITGVLVYLSLNVEATALEAFVDGRTTREVVSDLENGYTEDLAFAVAIPNQIQLSDGSETLVLYDDDFYVSIAPFINQTHECLMHVFTSCRAELVEASIQVRLVDQEGRVVFDGVKETYQNGFLGFWLQRNQTYTIEMNYEGYQGVFEFTTYEDSPTCLTDFRLD